MPVLALRAVLQAAAAAAVAALAAAALLAAAPAQAAVPTCPSPADRDVDYLCPVGPDFTTAPLIDEAGWGERSHFANILYGDLLGSGADELVARGPHGIEVYRWSDQAEQWVQLAVPPILPDREGWDFAPRYASLDLGDIDGDGRDELVARGADGFVVFEFVSRRDGNAGEWRQLTTSGPFADQRLRFPRYYLTFELSPIGALPGKATEQLVGRTPEGYEVWRWNGGGWTALAKLPELSDADGYGDDLRYLGIMAWDRQYLFARGESGMNVFRYLAGDDVWRRESFPSGPCGTKPSRFGIGCDTHTIQLVHGVPGAKDDVVLLARDQRAGYGIFLARYDISERRWTVPDQKPNPWKESYYSNRAYNATIQAADIDGDGAPEVIGRARDGMVAFRLNFRPDGLVGWGPPRSLGNPKLDGEPWQLLRHFATIETARLKTGTRARSLVARGPHGMRAWHWDAERRQFERPRRYGRFPALDERAIDAISSFLGIARGDVRDLYADPTRDPGAARLKSLRDTLATTCSGLTKASPPAYAECRAPGGRVPDADWQRAANVLIRELYWAELVFGHFGQLATVQEELFRDQQGVFPSITADLKIAKLPPARFGVDVKGLMWQVFETIIALDIPVVSQTYGVMAMTLGLMAAATPQWSGEAPSELDVEAADLQRHIARYQEALADAVRGQRRYVTGDPGLLAAVGRQVASGAWDLDPQLALSAGREGFTRYLYRAILPSLWDHWTVFECTTNTTPTACHPPRPGPLLDYDPGDPPQRVTFRGLVPKQDPCDHDFRIGGNRNCAWTSLEDWGYGETVKVLLDPISDDCRYDPARRTAWRYGCTLGESAAEVTGFVQPSPWRFRERSCDYPRYTNPAISCHVQAE